VRLAVKVDSPITHQLRVSFAFTSYASNKTCDVCKDQENARRLARLALKRKSLLDEQNQEKPSRWNHERYRNANTLEELEALEAEDDAIESTEVGRKPNSGGILHRFSQGSGSGSTTGFQSARSYERSTQ